MSVRRSLLAVLGMIVLLAAPAAGAQGLQTWVSPTYGFSVSWDPAQWQEEPGEALVAAGTDQLDRLLLLGEIGPLYIEGARRYGGVAGTCARDELRALTGEPGLSDVLPRPDFDADAPDASAAAAEATLQRQSGEAVRVITYVECRRAGADSVAIATLLAPVSDFPRHLALAEPVLTSIAFSGLVVGADVEFANLLEAARAGDPAAGPNAGELAFGPGRMASAEAGVDLADFAASATFANPYDSAEQPFDLGFAFRHTGRDEHIRLVIDSTGQWTLQDGLDTVSTGTLDGIRTGVGEANALDLVVRGSRGWFAVNGEFIDVLDLPVRTTPGDVLAVAGVFSENATVDATTRFSRFAVWPLPVEPGGAAAAGFGAWFSEASSGAPVAGPSAGELVQIEGQAALVNAGVGLADFAARVRWDNPTGIAPWDAGIAFRDQDDGSHYRLTVDQTGRWSFGVGAGEKMATGAAPSMDLTPGAGNVLEIVVSGGTAGFSINGEFVSQLDVSQIASAGDVWFGSGFSVSNNQPGRAIGYTEFVVWRAEGLMPPSSGDDVALAPPSEPIPLPPGGAAPAATPVSGDAGIIAVRIDEIGDSGVDGLATITSVDGEAYLNLVLRGAKGGELVVVHEGDCRDRSAAPAFLIEDPDAAGRSKTALGVPVEEIASESLAVVIYADAASFSQPLACGEIGN
jgi:hypothetical protein